MNRAIEHLDPQVPTDWLSVISEPTRLKILCILTAGDYTVTELAQACGSEMTKVSHHLSILKHIGLVKSQQEGRFIRYSLIGAKTTATLLELTHSSGLKVTIPLG